MTFVSLRIAPRLSRHIPTEYFVLANLKNKGKVIGRLADHPISEIVVDDRGLRYHYVGVATRGADGQYDVESLLPGEWIVLPGLVYALETKGR